MKQKKAKLPRGLHWKSDSPFIWFTWRDDRGKQHRQSTNTDDPAEAFSFRQQFLEKRKQDLEQTKSSSSDMAKWPLRRVAEEYFNWKCANSSDATVARERRIFKPVEKLFASDFRVNAITLAHIRQHPQVVRQWIQSGALEAENEGTERVRRWMISQEDLQRFEKKHRKLIAASHVDRERLRFICGYVFPSSHESLLRTRESKRSRRLTKSKWRARAKSKSPERSPLTQ